MALADILTPRVNELGKIKIGGLGAEKPTRAGGTFRAPRKDDHFTITTLHRAGGKPNGDLLPDTVLMDQLLREYGEGEGSERRLRRIPIFVLSNEFDDIMQSSYVWYIGKAVAGRSDGTKVEWFADPDAASPTRLREPRVEVWKPEYADWKEKDGKNRFKLHTTFNCVVAAGEGRWGGVYKFRTTSRISADQLYGSLVNIAMLTNGQLAGIPLQMVVRPMQVSPNGTATTVHVVHVEIRGSDMLAIQKTAREAARMRLSNAVQVRQIEQQYRRLLKAPGSETDEREIADIVNEFAPEQGEQHVEPAVADPLLDDEPKALPAPEEIEIEDSPPVDQIIEPAPDEPSVDEPDPDGPAMPPIDGSTLESFEASFRALASAHHSEAVIKKWLGDVRVFNRVVVDARVRNKVLDALQHGALKLTGEIDG